MNVTAVPTPHALPFNDQDKRTISDIGSDLSEQLKNSHCWNEECTELILKNPKMLFLYDRFEFSRGNAYGTSSYKIALNPMMIMCYHLTVLRKVKGHFLQ
jgi:hypothetical protein